MGCHFCCPSNPGHQPRGWIWFNAKKGKQFYQKSTSNMPPQNLKLIYIYIYIKMDSKKNYPFWNSYIFLFLASNWY